MILRGDDMDNGYNKWIDNKKEINKKDLSFLLRCYLFS